MIRLDSAGYPTTKTPPIFKLGALMFIHLMRLLLDGNLFLFYDLLLSLSRDR